MEKLNKRVSSAQWDIICNYLEQHPCLARGYTNSSRGRELSKRLWQELADLLNADGSGAFKSPKEWSAYFNNYKAKLKKHISDINKEVSGTGGGAPTVESLSDRELRVAAIMGDGFGQGAPNVRVNPFPNMAPQEPPNVPEMQLPIIFDSFPEDTVAESENPITVEVSPSEATFVPSVPRRLRHTRYRTRPMAPIDEARRILSDVERQRAASDAAMANSLNLLAENVGRIATVLERFFSREP